jgi:hypothetical protein
MNQDLSPFGHDFSGVVCIKLESIFCMLAGVDWGIQGLASKRGARKRCGSASTDDRKLFPP